MKEEKDQKAESDSPFDAKGFAEGEEHGQEDAEVELGPGFLISLPGPHSEDPCSRAWALGRLEFLSPWGSSILRFHYSIFMVTWGMERRGVHWIDA